MKQRYFFALLVLLVFGFLYSEGTNSFLALTQTSNVAQVSNDTFPPSIPTDLTAIISGVNQITLRWSPSFDRGGIDGYKVFRDGTQVYTTLREEYIDKNLVPGQSYTYTIQSYDRSGNISDYSASYIVKLAFSEKPTTVAQKELQAVAFTKNLYFTLENNEVLLLQKKLQQLGYFPQNVEPNGYFGRTTLKSVLSYQKATGVSTTGFVGPLTRAQLNTSGSIATSATPTSVSESAKFGYLVTSTVVKENTGGGSTVASNYVYQNSPTPPVTDSTPTIPSVPTPTTPASSTPPVTVTPTPPSVTPPAPPPSTPQPNSCNAPATPVPNLARWESDMIKYGKQHAQFIAAHKNDTDVSQVLGEIYYDGSRVFSQIASYTNDTSWYQAADDAVFVYRRYIVPNKYAAAGYMIFTKGLFESYKRTNDVNYKNDIISLSQKASFALDGTPLAWTAPTSASREVAYNIISMGLAEQLGAPHRARYDSLVNQALSHIDQWFVSKSAPYVRPFMVGLTADALIEHYNWTKDPRVLPALKIAADGLWATTWLPNSKAFMYTDRIAPDNSGDMRPSPDLNNLIVHMYAWIWHMTGDVSYRDKADQIFSGGVLGGYLAGGKQFNQNYKSAFDYLKYRNATPVTCGG